MSRRQDYIARVRYQNPLPAPPAAPKLIDTVVDVSRLLTAGALSSAVAERELNPDVDLELGMPIDLTEVPHAFDADTDIFGEGPEPELDPEDLELLVDPIVPESSGTANASGNSDALGVSFLRRTEYISSEALRNKIGSAHKSLSQQAAVDQQLQKIQRQFEIAQTPLEQIKHPRKKNLKAVKAHNLLPDSKMFDLQHMSLRMIGSASLKARKVELSPEQLKSSLFYSFKAGEDEDAEQWMGMFAADEGEDAETLSNRIADTQDTLTTDQLEEEEHTRWLLKKVQDFDVDYELHQGNFEEVVITTKDDTAYYVPLQGRVQLKRRRIELRKLEGAMDHNIDDIDLGLRELTEEESVERDAARSGYDPVSYSTEN